MSDNEINAHIRATDETGPAIDSAQTGFSQFEDKIDSGFERIAERMAEYFAVEKIASFVKDSITAFAKFDRAIGVLSVQVKANGEDWGKLRGHVDDFIKSEEVLSGQTRGKLVQSLTLAETMTHKLAAAMKVTDVAQKLAFLSGHDLREVTQQVALAYEGNSRGLSGMTRLLAPAGTQAKSTADVFKLLGKETAHAGDVMGDTQSKLNSLSATWEDTTENVGKALAPLIGVFAGLEKVVSTALTTLFALANFLEDVGVADFDTLVNEIGRAVQAFQGLEMVLHGNIKAGIVDIGKAAIGAVTDMTGTVSDSYRQMANDGGKAAHEIAGYWEGSTKKISVMSDAEFAHEAVLNADRAKASLVASKNSTRLTKQTLKDKTKLHDDYNKHLLAQIKAQLMLEKQVHREAEKSAKSYEKAITSSVQKVTVATLKGTKSMSQAYAALGKSIVKEVIGALAKVLEEKAIWYMVQGIAEMISSYGATGETDLIAGAGLAAAAGVMQGAADAYLAEGGVVTRPTRAMIGEGGEPEAVVPLSKASSMGFGGGGQTTHNWNISLPGVTDAKGLVDKLPALLQAANRRTGQRFATI